MFIGCIARSRGSWDEVYHPCIQKASSAPGFTKAWLQTQLLFLPTFPAFSEFVLAAFYAHMLLRTRTSSPGPDLWDWSRWPHWAWSPVVRGLNWFRSKTHIESNAHIRFLLHILEKSVPGSQREWISFNQCALATGRSFFVEHAWGDFEFIRECSGCSKHIPRWVFSISFFFYKLGINVIFHGTFIYIVE